MEHHNDTITTIETLAELIQRSMATKEDMAELRGELTALRAAMQEGFAGVYTELGSLTEELKQYR
jgi:hypothetical protein